MINTDHLVSPAMYCILFFMLYGNGQLLNPPLTGLVPNIASGATEAFLSHSLMLVMICPSLSCIWNSFRISCSCPYTSMILSPKSASV